MPAALDRLMRRLDPDPTPEPEPEPLAYHNPNQPPERDPRLHLPGLRRPRPKPHLHHPRLVAQRPRSTRPRRPHTGAGVGLGRSTTHSGQAQPGGQMTHNCETCARPISDGATFCVNCGHQLDNAIADISAYHGLAYDLDITTTRQARIGSREGARSTETPVAYDQRASETSTHLRVVLASWARLIAEETGDTLPADDLARIAAWLRPRVGWLRHHPAGAEAHNEILDAVRDARRVVDRPAERLYAGPCDCGEDLYARTQAIYVECRNPECQTVWNVDERRVWLLRSAEDLLLTATEISRAIGTFTPSAVRGYAARRRLVQHGERVENGKLYPLYRLGDALDILAQQAERVSA